MLDNFINTEWNEVLDVILRSFISLMTLFLVTKLIGKKQVSQLSLFDYVIGISIGNFAAEMTISLESQYMNGITAILIFGGVAYLVNYITMKSIILRRFFIGVPTVIIQNGNIIYKNLKKIKFDINDLLEECRVNGYFDISQIEYALFEVNGELSILPKAEYRQPTMKDMSLNPGKEGLCANVIIDGNIMHENLDNMNKSDDWLKKELSIKGYQDIKNVLLATVDQNEKITIYEKNNIKEIKVLE